MNPQLTFSIYRTPGNYFRVAIYKEVGRIIKLEYLTVVNTLEEAISLVEDRENIGNWPSDIFGTYEKRKRAWQLFEHDIYLAELNYTGDGHRKIINLNTQNIQVGNEEVLLEELKQKEEAQ